MSESFPCYYGEFSCIADRCRHSCCIGWDIDIDGDTLCYYRTLSGELGQKIAANIETDADGGAHFLLSQDERCPFLQNDGLCEIISTLGEGALCDICTDHPRFRNFPGERCEIGLGLCCEEAARIILGLEEKFFILGDGDDSFCRLRRKIFALLQNRERPINERVEDVLRLCGVRLPQRKASEWKRFFLSLERLSPEWDAMLENLEKPATPVDEFSVAFEQLLCYFIFRHLSPECVAEGAMFAAVSYFTVLQIFAAEGERSFARLCEVARMYSAEIEYSNENLAAVFGLQEN